MWFECVEDSLSLGSEPQLWKQSTSESLITKVLWLISLDSTLIQVAIRQPCSQPPKKVHIEIQATVYGVRNTNYGVSVSQQ